MGNEDILDEVVGMLHEANMTFVPGASNRTLLVLCRDDAGNKLSAEIRIHEHISLLAVSALYPLAIPDPRREAIGQYIIRANSYEVEGHFEFDHDDGQGAIEPGALTSTRGRTGRGS